MKTAAAHKQIYFWLYLIAAITFITGVSSCNMPGACVPELPKPVDGRIKTIKGADITPRPGITYGNYISEFTYDNDKKLKTAVVDYNGALTSYSYTYTVQNVKGEVKQIAYNSRYNETFILNAAGYASEWNLVVGTKSNFDTEGHKTKLTITFVTSVVENYTWDAKGNMTEKKVIKNQTTTTTTYTYTEVKDLRVDGLDWFYGKRSTYLPATETTNGITKKYTYGYDKKGRVIWYSFDGKEVSYTYFD